MSEKDPPGIPSAEIIQLRPQPEDGDEPLNSREKDKRCWHRRFELDDDSRRVYCRECKEEIDPFTVLEFFTREYERYREHLESVKRELAAKRGELDEVKRQTRNEKAKLNRAAAKTGTPKRALAMERAQRERRGKT